MSFFKNNIKVERAKKDITQAELAEQVNTTRQTIHYIEKGKTEPSIGLADRIAKFFNSDIITLFNLEDK